VTDRELTPLYARVLVHLIRPFPDFEFFFIRSLRKKAVHLLQLKPGDRVLDVGCGPGGSLPYLVDAVGPSGEVVGVEISPEMAVNARRRIATNEWENVQVVVAKAESARLEGQFDGLLLFAAQDVCVSPQSLSNLVPHLKDGARVVAFGGKLSRRPFAGLVNVPFRAMFSKLTFPSTPGLNYEPWALLRVYLREFSLEEYFFGWMFLAWGSVSPTAQQDESKGNR
jgi:demethylmenaquinone methyltransferase/2-methoxy-6-polyprenyl-1,4-benzoquinol methylase